MPEHSHEELRTDGDENQVDALNRCLRVLDLDNLLGALFEFVETFVKHSLGETQLSDFRRVV